MEHNRFGHLDLTKEDSHKEVISIFVLEFSKAPNNPRECCFSLLHELFQLLSFDFSYFLKSLLLTPTHTDRFVSYVLYGIYYYEIPLAGFATFNNTEHVDYFLLSLMAECLESVKMETIIKELSFVQQLRLGTFCAVYNREGTWTLFNILSAKYPQDQLWNKLFTLLRSKYFDSSYLNALILNYTFQLTPSLQFLVEALEKLATEHILKIIQILPDLIATIILSDNQERIHQFSGDILHEPENLKKLFAAYFMEVYTFEEMKQFFQIFGLKGHVLTDSSINNLRANDSLADLLQTLLDLFQKPERVSEEEHRILFVLNLCQQLYIFHRQPTIYAQGLENLVFALPTRGSELPAQSWLRTVLEGIKAIENHLKKSNA